MTAAVAKIVNKQLASHGNTIGLIAAEGTKSNKQTGPLI